MKIKINHDNENLYCIYSKERIEIGEKYVEVEEEFSDDVIVKTYKLENAPSDEDSDDNDGLYIGMPD